MMSSAKSEISTRDRFSTIKWFFQAISGIFLVFFLGVHLYVAHINGGAPVELFDSVLLNLSNPWWFTFFIAFVWIITYHALNGVKGIVYDMGVRLSRRKYVTYGFTAIYFATVIYGTLLTVIIANTVA